MKHELEQLILSDLSRYGYSSEKEMGFMIRKECYGFKYSKTLRKCKWYKDHNNKIAFIFERIKLSVLTEKTGFQISYATDIGPGLYLGHMGNVVINWETKIGSNVNIAQGVTIGRTNNGENSGVPSIGNNVWIGANATIVGGITIGDDVMVAPNTFVNFDVPSHSLVIMNHANIIRKENATRYYINNTI